MCELTTCYSAVSDIYRIFGNLLLFTEAFGELLNQIGHASSCVNVQPATPQSLTLIVSLEISICLPKHLVIFAPI